MIETRACIDDFHFHLVFVTKYRKCVFDTEKKRNELKELLEAFSKKNGSEIEVIEIMPDHVHLVISFLPKFAQSSIVKSFKRLVLVSSSNFIQKTRLNYTKDICGALASLCVQLVLFQKKPFLNT